MKLPTLASPGPFGAWSLGFAFAVAGTWLPLALPLGLGFDLVPLAAAGLALYCLTVRPRAVSTSGVLLGVLPLVAYGVIDGLLKCASFNRRPSGGCEADPSAQLMLMSAAYLGAILFTGIALWQMRTSSASTAPHRGGGA